MFQEIISNDVSDYKGASQLSAYLDVYKYFVFS